MWLAPLLMVVSAISNYAGAAMAIGLFAELPAWLVAWLRMSASALILVAIWRPHYAEFWGRSGALALFFGCATFGMNAAFYEAIARLPLGTAVALEFSGPIMVAALGSRTLRDWLALILAGSGVLILSGAQWEVSATGVLFALLAAAMWAAYILLGSQISKKVETSASSMSVGFFWAAMLSLPAALWAFPKPAELSHSLLWLLLLALGLGALSSVIPYSLDQVIMRMAGATYFSILLALLPVVGALVGALALSQVLSQLEIIGMIFVVLAVLCRKPEGRSTKIAEVSP
ncbi:Threonine/homoserine exporter RhtA [Corynebacterium caspium DSM 44850]|nr:Threonine/homoserine exporter RhtA [Corynebacterium caspium DSM 44850]